MRRPLTPPRALTASKHAIAPACIAWPRSPSGPVSAVDWQIFTAAASCAAPAWRAASGASAKEDRIWRRVSDMTVSLQRVREVWFARAARLVHAMTIPGSSRSGPTRKLMSGRRCLREEPLVLVAQHVLLHLAHRVARQGLCDEALFRDLEVGQPRLELRDDGVALDARAGLGDPDRDADLAEVRMRHADHRA